MTAAAGAGAGACAATTVAAPLPAKGITPGDAALMAACRSPVPIQIELIGGCVTYASNGTKSLDAVVDMYISDVTILSGDKRCIKLKATNDDDAAHVELISLLKTLKSIKRVGVCTNCSDVAAWYTCSYIAQQMPGVEPVPVHLCARA